MNLKSYKTYKESGIQWLGDIPEHWEVSHIKRVSKNITDGAHISPDLSSKDFPFLSVVNLKQNILDFVNCHFTSKNDYEQLLRNGCKPEKGNVLFSKDGTIGETIVVKENIDFVVGSSFIIVRPIERNINSEFLNYFLSSKFVKDSFKVFIKGTGVPRLSIFNFSKLNIAIPPLNEQTQIAQYLDQKIAAIDKKVALLKRKIKYYKAYRKTLINETVTQGLNSDNKKWRKVRLKDIGKLYSGLSGKSGNDFNQEEHPSNKSFIPFTNIANNFSIDKNQLGQVIVEENENQNQVAINDLFFLMSSEGYGDIGKSSVLENEIGETYLNSFCKGFRISDTSCYSRFINYLLLSDCYRQQLIIEGKGFTRINLKMEKLNNFSIKIPSSIKEQQEIAQFLDTKTTTIDHIITSTSAQIKTLKEFRKTLINDVVTGKLKVTA